MINMTEAAQRMAAPPDVFPGEAALRQDKDIEIWNLLQSQTAITPDLLREMEHKELRALAKKLGAHIMVAQGEENWITDSVHMAEDYCYDVLLRFRRILRGEPGFVASDNKGK